MFGRTKVLLSGGFDSTLLLHLLTQKSDETIHTYTIGLNEEDFETGTRVAEHYGSAHTNVEITNLLPTFAKLQTHLDRPRWNLWPYWGYKAAKEDDCDAVFIGEGMDEHFGGYWYKPEVTYQEYWSGVLMWSLPTHLQIADLFSLKLETPFIRLDVRFTLPFWDWEHRNKNHLRKAYADILPDFVLEKKKSPGRIDFLRIWDDEISQHIPGPPPETMEEAYKLLNKWTIERWLEAQ